MIFMKSVTKPEGTYFFGLAGATGDHFGIDCPCGVFSGYTTKNASERFVYGIQLSEDHFKDLREHFDKKSFYGHTFFCNQISLETDLKKFHKREPLIVVCAACEQEFPLTLETYQELKKESDAQEE